jgi:predicted CXXCH cytochrome family protein
LARVRNIDQLAADLPQIGEEAAYVSSNRCQACHPSQHESWHRTYHRTMTQEALPENVVGEFDGRTVSSDGLAYRVFREGDAFWAEMPDPEQMMYVVQGGRRIDQLTYWIKRNNQLERFDLRTIPRVRRRVVMTTGSHHYQTYWVTGDKKYGRLLQTLPLVYLIKDRCWIPREAAFMVPPDGTRMITQWNHHCIRCHSTAGVPGLDAQTGKLNTRVAELGIACEACHGPGEEHIRRNQDPRRRYQLHLAGGSDPTIVNPEKLDHRASSEVCGQCHGVYIMRNEYAMKYAFEGSLYRPGKDLHRTRYYIQHPRNDSSAQRWEDLKANREFFQERWWDDGTVLAGGREYTAMSVSGCYTRGNISCLSCHSMHQSDPADQLKTQMDGNKACTQCHDQAKYTSQANRHTFHSADSSGASCMNCHMPHTTYALFSAIRNHQIGSPNVVGSVRDGVPNACNLCHLDKTVAWTQQYLDQWYGQKPLELSAEQETVSAALLWLLKGHAAQRVIVAWHVGWSPAQEASGDDWLAPFLAPLLADPYGVVRYVAGRSLQTLPGFEDLRYDFLARHDELERQATAALSRWQSEVGGRVTRSGDELLIDADGNVLQSRVESLLSQQDSRPVTIKE